MRTHAATNSWKLTVNKAVVLRPDSDLPDHLTFSSVQVSVFPYPDQTTANVELVTAENQDKPITLSIHRYRNEDVPRETFTIQTGRILFACWLLNDFWPSSKSFGTISQFVGYAKFEKHDKSWSGHVSPGSSFQSMDLQSLSNPFGKNIQGFCLPGSKSAKSMPVRSYL